MKKKEERKVPTKKPVKGLGITLSIESSEAVMRLAIEDGNQKLIRTLI